MNHVKVLFVDDCGNVSAVSMLCENVDTGMSEMKPYYSGKKIVGIYMNGEKIETKVQ